MFSQQVDTKLTDKEQRDKRKCNKEVKIKKDPGSSVERSNPVLATYASSSVKCTISRERVTAQRCLPEWETDGITEDSARTWVKGDRAFLV